MIWGGSDPSLFLGSRLQRRRQPVLQRSRGSLLVCRYVEIRGYMKKMNCQSSHKSVAMFGDHSTQKNQFYRDGTTREDPNERGKVAMILASQRRSWCTIDVGAICRGLSRRDWISSIKINHGPLWEKALLGGGVWQSARISCHYLRPLIFCMREKLPNPIGLRNVQALRFHTSSSFSHG